MVRNRTSHTIPLSRRLLARLLTPPPPLLWRFKNQIPQVEWRGPKSLRAIPSVAAKQLNWWVIRPFVIIGLRILGYQRRPNGAPPEPPLPRRLVLAACWLNSFMPYEVRRWQALGFTTWDSISQKIPESHCHAIHAARRAHWPNQCIPAMAVLSDKAALLERADPAWRSPFLTLQGNGPLEHPGWWRQALTGPGLVIKPLRGHAGRGVVRFQLDGTQLLCEALGQPIKKIDLEASYATEAISPRWLMDHWQQLVDSQEPALAMPFLQQAASLPASHPAAVVRVITEQAAPGAAVRVQIAWIFVPLPASQEGRYSPVARLNLRGQVLPEPGLQLTAEQEQQQACWQTLLAKGPVSTVERCLSLSISMHQRLSPIDQVAWEWIPAEPEAQLLEGNSVFGLMVPQMFDAMQASIRKTSVIPPYDVSFQGLGER